jgi:diadenosine tetraphosphatase ApaH/serine/threonine PP2A family protein phosphatase
MDPLQGYVYPDSDLAPFHGLPHDVVLMGHTHRPFAALSGTVKVVNVGSCGLPRDVGNLASCATYDTSSRDCEILRIEFNAAALTEELRDRIDASVASCLARTGPFVGRMIND